MEIEKVSMYLTVLGHGLNFEDFPEVDGFHYNIETEKAFDWHDYHFNGLYYTNYKDDAKLPQSTLKVCCTPFDVPAPTHTCMCTPTQPHCPLPTCGATTQLQCSAPTTSMCRCSMMHQRVWHCCDHGPFKTVTPLKSLRGKRPAVKQTGTQPSARQEDGAAQSPQGGPTAAGGHGHVVCSEK